MPEPEKPTTATPDPPKERRRAGSGSEDGDSAGESTSTRTSTRSGKRAKPSSKRWRKPANVKEFASQVNEVATLVLNGELDIDQARTYASLARVVAQTVSVEVTRSRFLKEIPDLEFGEDTHE